jgi:electron transfer flavoprotein alpha subunit
MPADKGIWVLAEQRQGELQDVSLELMSEGHRIAEKLGEELCVVLVGSNIGDLADSLALWGADKVYLVDNPLLSEYCSELYVQAISALISGRRPNIVLCGATWIGRDLASRLAAKLKTGLVSDCVSLNLSEEGLLLQTKPAYDGKVHATVICPTARPQIATISPGTMEIRRPRTAKRAELIKLSPGLDTTQRRIKVLGFLNADLSTISVDEAEIIVAGGGGVGSAEGFKILAELAYVLGGSLAVSRVPVDKGWVPFERQIGQTGKTVSPKLYIACGISGSIYHNMGMRGSRLVVSINKDRNAPIFKISDMCVVGDLFEIVPAIVRQLRGAGHSLAPTR